MPQLPTYNSQARMTTDQPEAIRTGAAEPYEIASKTLGAAQDVTVKWQSAVNNMQETAAKASILESQTQILSNAEADTDINGEEKQFLALQQAKDQALKGVSDTGLKSRLGFELKHEANIASIKIKGIYAQKKRLADNLNTELILDNYASQGKTEDMKLLMSEKVSAGFYSVEDGAKILNNKLKLMAEYDIQNDTATKEGASAVLAELRKGENGKYKDLSPSDRLDMIQAAQRRIFQNNQTFKRDVEDSQNLRNNNLIDKFASQEVTIKDIEAEEAIPEEAGGMKRSTLLTYKRAVISGIQKDLNRMLQEKTPDKNPTARSKAIKQYNDLIDDFMDDKSDQWKAKEMLAEAYADGIINSGEQKFLNTLKQNLKDIEFNRSTNPIVSAMKGLKDFFKLQTNADDEEIARKMKSLVGGLSQGEEPQVMLKKMLNQEVVSRIPDISTYPKTGRLKRDGNGNVIRVFPDGSYEEVTESKPKE